MYDNESYLIGVCQKQNISCVCVRPVNAYL